MKKNAIITGFSKGIGKALCLELENDYNIIRLNSRLEDTKALELELKNLLKICDIDLLISCAGFGIFSPLEEISAKNIQKLIAVNLTAPILLSSLLLRSLKKTKGHIINISSIEALRSSKFSCLYTASKAGLRAFSLSLFEELRNSGVKVTCINPDLTKTSFFENLHFEPSEEEGTFLNPKEIAKQVRSILEFDGVVCDITLRAQKFGLKKKKKSE